MSEERIQDEARGDDETEDVELHGHGKGGGSYTTPVEGPVASEKDEADEDEDDVELHGHGKGGGSYTTPVEGPVPS